MMTSVIRNLLILFVLSVGLLAAGCSEDVNVREVVIPFRAEVNGERYRCGDVFSNVGVGESEEDRLFSVSDFRMYVHSVELVSLDGAREPVTLEEDDYQNDGTALLDFENGCGNGDVATRERLRGTVEDRPYVDICFRLGVPFEQNYLDVAVADSPLNDSSMYWSWTLGHKYLRIDGMGGSREEMNPFNIHLGSTGCQATSETELAPEEECANPNRPEVCVRDFDFENGTVVADVGRVLSESDVSIDDGVKPGCMSSPMDPECIDIMPRLGIVFSSQGGLEPLQYSANPAFFSADASD